MPNITLYISQDRMPPEEMLVALTERCTALCTGILRAALENVHIILSPFGMAEAIRPLSRSNTASNLSERGR